MTRPEHQAGSLRAALESHGATVLSVPVIAIEPLPERSALAAIETAYQRLSSFRWILFTSTNTVSVLNSLWDADWKQKIVQDRPPFLGAIGQKTAAALKDLGLPVALCPSTYLAEEFLSLLLEQDEAALRQGSSVLLPRAERAREVLPDGLREVGARVEILPVYRTVAGKPTQECLALLQQLQSNDWITFTSASTVEHLIGMLGEFRAKALLLRIRSACVGPITADTLRGFGIEPTVTAETSTMDHLVEAILAVERKKP